MTPERAHAEAEKDLARAEAELRHVKGERDEARAERGQAYRERAALVAYLSSCYPSVMLTDSAEPDWPIVFVSTPSGQMSWHIAATDTDLFQHVPSTTCPTWDGHTTDQKYQRLAGLTRTLTVAVAGAPDYLALLDQATSLLWDTGMPGNRQAAGELRASGGLEALT